MLEYIIRFIIGGAILVSATYFTKSKNLFLAGIITTLPLMTIVNMLIQTKYLTVKEFQASQKNGVIGGVGLALFVLGCIVLSNWMKPIYAMGISILIYFLYVFLCKYLIP